MNVNKWGPGGWTFLHTITFNYPLEPENDDKNRYKNFFSSVSEMLPCKYCRDSFKTYIKFIPIDEFLESRIGVTYWLYRIHQLVDEKVFKKNDSFENVIRKYENFRAKTKLITSGSKLNEIREIHRGGGFGSIIGRNSFQRPKKEALILLSQIIDIYKGK